MEMDYSARAAIEIADRLIWLRQRNPSTISEIRLIEAQMGNHLDKIRRIRDCDM